MGLLRGLVHRLLLLLRLFLRLLPCHLKRVGATVGSQGAQGGEQGPSSN